MIYSRRHLCAFVKSIRRLTWLWCFKRDVIISQLVVSFIDVLHSTASNVANNLVTASNLCSVFNQAAISGFDTSKVKNARADPLVADRYYARRKHFSAADDLLVVDKDASGNRRDQKIRAIILDCYFSNVRGDVCCPVRGVKLIDRSVHLGQFVRDADLSPDHARACLRLPSSWVEIQA